MNAKRFVTIIRQHILTVQRTSTALSLSLTPSLTHSFAHTLLPPFSVFRLPKYVSETFVFEALRARFHFTDSLFLVSSPPPPSLPLLPTVCRQSNYDIHHFTVLACCRFSHNIKWNCARGERMERSDTQLTTHKVQRRIHLWCDVNRNKRRNIIKLADDVDYH